MNLVDQLLKADVKKAEELETGVFQSHRLAKILGSKEETVEITLREVKSRRVNDIIAYQVDRKGRFDYSKSYDAKLMMCIEGIIEPDLRNKELQGHFGCKDAKELCEKLFGSEIDIISDEISKLCGIKPEKNEDGEDEDIEDELKN